MMIPHDTSLRKAALLTAVSSIILAALAMFAEIAVHQGMILPGDAAGTMQKVLAGTALFKAGIVALSLAVLTDLIVALGYYRFLKTVHERKSQTAAWIRVVYSIIFGIAVFHFANGFMLISENNDAMNAMMQFKKFEQVWSVALIVFSFHLLGIGCLAWKSGYVPKFFGLALMIAAAGYFADNMFKLFLEPSSYDQLKPVLLPVVALASFSGELGLAIWMLFRGGKNNTVQAKQF